MLNFSSITDRLLKKAKRERSIPFGSSSGYLDAHPETLQIKEETNRVLLKSFSRQVSRAKLLNNSHKQKISDESLNDINSTISKNAKSNPFMAGMNFFSEYEHKIRERIEFLVSEYSIFIKDMRFERNRIFLSIDLLFEVVINYFADIHRLKLTHEIKGNIIRTASYEAYWLSKLRPIQIKSNAHIQGRQKYLLANENFVIYHILARLFDKSIMSECNLMEFTSLISRFLYELHQHNLTPQAIELVLTSLIIVPPYKKKSDVNAV